MNTLLKKEGEGEEQIKRKALYSVLNDFEVFSDQKVISTTVIESEEDGEEAEEGKEKVVSHSVFQKALIKQCKLRKFNAYHHKPSVFRVRECLHVILIKGVFETD